MSSVQRKFNVKSLGETSVKNMMYPVVKASSIETTNALNTLNLCLFREVVNDILELLQRFKSLHVYDAARKQSSNFAYFNRKYNTSYCKNIDIFSLSYCLQDFRFTKRFSKSKNFKFSAMSNIFYLGLFCWSCGSSR